MKAEMERFGWQWYCNVRLNGLSSPLAPFSCSRPVRMRKTLEILTRARMRCVRSAEQAPASGTYTVYIFGAITYSFTYRTVPSGVYLRHAFATLEGATLFLSLLLFRCHKKLLMRWGYNLWKWAGPAICSTRIPKKQREAT